LFPYINAAGNIVSLLNEIVTATQRAEAYEIIYVDDGSTDRTAAILKTALQNVNVLRVIRHQRPCGQSAAIWSGVKATRYSWIATLDGDGQNDPADIPRLYHQLVKQKATCPRLSMVAGWRTNRHDSAWRVVSSRVANRVRAVLLGDWATMHRIPAAA
jgi:dolichol-phosphate mannosyltransferase